MEKVWITIEILDVEKTEIDLTDEGKLTFKAESHGQKYGFVMELFNGVDKEHCGWSLKGRNVVFSLAKKEDDQEEYWPRLTKDKVKNAKIAIDWSRWVDEDEVDEAPAAQDDEGMQGFGGPGGPGGPGGMGGMGGMPGMPGMGGPGGAGGMDMAQMMQMMGGAGGAGGAGGMDMAKMQEMMAQMQGGGAGGMGGMDMGGMMGGADSDDEDEEEEAEGEPHKADLGDLEGEAEKPIQE